MDIRIANFEALWHNRLLPPPPLVRSAVSYDLFELPEIPPPPELRRQTNRHVLLPHYLRVRWYAATTYEEQEAIMNLYEDTK
jgi:hypothetical protein